jgi:hypothetical protein
MSARVSAECDLCNCVENTVRYCVAEVSKRDGYCSGDGEGWSGGGDVS